MNATQSMTRMPRDENTVLIRRFTRLAVEIALTLLLSVPVFAQDGGGIMGGGSTRTVSASGPKTTSEVSDLRLPDPHKELCHLSKNLKLKRDQRVGVSIILQERTREIRLLLDIESLSHEYRDTLATKVMEDSGAQIETLLRSKQKRKFDKELARENEAH